MLIKIVPSDNFVSVDGVVHTLNITFPEGVHFIQWDGEAGYIHNITGDGGLSEAVITDFSTYQHIYDDWLAKNNYVPVKYWLNGEVGYTTYDNQDTPDGAVTSEPVDICRDRLFEDVKAKSLTLMAGGVTVTTSHGSKNFQSRDADARNVMAGILRFDKESPAPSSIKHYTTENERLDFTEADFTAIGLKMSDLALACDARKEVIRGLLDAETTSTEVQSVYDAQIDTGWPTVPYSG